MRVDFFLLEIPGLYKQLTQKTQQQLQWVNMRVRKTEDKKVFILFARGNTLHITSSWVTMSFLHVLQHMGKLREINPKSSNLDPAGSSLRGGTPIYNTSTLVTKNTKREWVLLGHFHAKFLLGALQFWL